MSASTVALLVIVALGLVVVAVVSPIRWLRHRAASSRAQLTADLAAEPALRGPERATYQGSTGGYPKVAGTGMIALTQHRLLFRKMTGGRVDLLLTEISGARLATSFNRTKVGGTTVLVLQATLGELGYLVTDPIEWLDAITGAAPGLESHESPNPGS